MADLDSAVSLGKQLKESEEFYKLCMETAHKRFDSFYTEEKWLENWNRQWTK
jgi:hypothetical protein